MMAIISKGALGAAATTVLLAAAPVAAQSISYADPVVAIAKTQARSVGYSQINQTYASNIQSIQQKSTQMQTLLSPLDSNGDGTVDQTEMNAASASSRQQIQTLNQEMENLQKPIRWARIYVLEQIDDQYSAAQADVVKKNKIDVILQPESIIYAPTSANVTEKLTNAMDARIPQIKTAPPADWAARRSSVSLYSQVEEILQLDAYLSALMQAQQAGGTPAAAPAPAPAEGSTR